MNFDPIHWACVGLGIILALVLSVGGTVYWKQSQDLKVCHAEYEAYTSKTTALGLKSELDQRNMEYGLATAAVNIQGALNETQIKLNSAYADRDRMLRDAKARAGSSEARSLSDAASGLNCSSGTTGLTSALARLDLGVQPILKSRDEAINRNIACKKYIEEVTLIMNRNLEMP